MTQALWVYAAEVFPTSHRVIGLGFVVSFARIGSIASLFLAYVLFEASASAALWLCFASCILVRSLLADTSPFSNHEQQAIGIVNQMPRETNQQDLVDN